MHTDASGNVLLPKWFLAFLSVVLTLISIGVLPFATSVVSTLNLLSVELSTLRTRFDGRIDLQNEVIRNIYTRMERIENTVDWLAQQRAKEIQDRH